VKYHFLSLLIISIKFRRNRAGELSGIALGYGVDDRKFEPRQGLGIFFFTTASRPVLEPTQPPIQ
jgi:hypothetical protein